jgi:hypothetical protein
MGEFLFNTHPRVASHIRSYAYGEPRVVRINDASVLTMKVTGRALQRMPASAWFQVSKQSPCLENHETGGTRPLCSVSRVGTTEPKPDMKTLKLVTKNEHESSDGALKILSRVKA